MIREGLTLALEDNQQAWLMQPDGSYVQRHGDASARHCQQQMIERTEARLKDAIEANKDAAEAAKKKLEEAGAKIELK